MTVNGRTYTCAVGATPILVPDFDALVLLSNGWLASTADGAGTTAQRPLANQATSTPAPNVGFSYFDTTLGTKVVWNGKNWINHATGASA
jgi:hypothetical protein